MRYSRARELIMRVFMTGATGFIGRHLCTRLVERGHHVIALVRSPQRARALLPSSVQTIEGDMTLFAQARPELPECDVVIHLAGVVAAQRGQDYDTTNRRAVLDLIRCLSAQSWAPKRLVFTSSLAAAGPSPEHRAWTEDDALSPIDAYGESKARAEVAVRKAPFPTTIVRPPIVLGAGDSASLTLFRAARSGVGLRVAGRPQQLSFVDVRDLADALVLIAEDKRPASFAYYASHPRAVDLVELWSELSRAVGSDVRIMVLPKWLLYLAMRAATTAAAIFRFKNQLDEKQYRQITASAFVCSSARLSAELGWRPKYGLADCVTAAADGYRVAGSLRPPRR
jgi:nucleoside-diphosphate-sugar epimerase